MTDNKSSVKPLSPRQLEVLQLQALGFGQKSVAYALGLTIDTVKKQGIAIRERLHAENTAHAVYIGCRTGIIE